ncbi:MAG TPA: hypothetical protein VK628_03830, partial [Flavitalea sp.]|nr:hypothetical protein [Flavitalea sp.]
MKRAFLFVIFSFQLIVFAQAPGLEWVKVYGQPLDHDVPTSVDTDLEGNVYIGATLRRYDLYGKVRIAKYSASGTLIWSKIYIPDFDYAGVTLVSMDTDSIGNICILVYVSIADAKTVTVLQKYNGSGTKLWTVVEKLNDVYVIPRAMSVDKLGYVYVAGTLGYYGSYNQNTSDYFVFKYNKTGSKSWGAIYNGTANEGDEAYDIIADAAGNCYVTGRTKQQDSRSGAKSTQNTTIKYSSGGYFQWARNYTYGSAYYGIDHNLELDGLGNPYLFVHSSAEFGPVITNVATVIKYNNAGTQIWTKSITGLVYSPLNSTTDFAGNCYLAAGVTGPGSEHYNYSTYKVSSGGVLLWNTKYNGDTTTWDLPYDIAVDAVGDVYVTGASAAGPPDGPPTSFVLEKRPKATTIKYSPSGSQLWVTKYSGHKTDPGPWAIGTRLRLHGSGSTPLVYVAGNTVNEAPDTQVHLEDLLLLKYNPAKIKSANSTLEQIGLISPVSNYKLSAAPNPFKSSTVIRFDLPFDAQVSLK